MNQIANLVKDDQVSLALCVLIVVALTFFHDKLSPVKDFMGNWYGKLAVLLAVLYLAHHNVPLALMVTVLVVSL